MELTTKIKKGIWTRSAVSLAFLGLTFLLTGLWLQHWALYLSGSFILFFLLLVRIMLAPWPNDEMKFQRGIHKGTVQEDDELSVLLKGHGVAPNRIVQLFDKVCKI